MVKLVEIPQDIIESVIAEVGDDTRLLKQCSLVSSSFLLPSRKQLFSRIALRNDQTCKGIHQLLVQNPVIQPFVRIITLEESNEGYEFLNGTSLPAILRLPFRRLECFTIWNSGRKFWHWNSFSSELKDALSNIIHSSSLKTLSLETITDLPITFFLQIVHLTTLELLSFYPIDFDDESSSLLTSKGVAPVIDRCMWYVRREDGYGLSTRFPLSAYFSLIQDIVEPVFLPFMCGLVRFFEIDVRLGSATLHDFDLLWVLMSSLCISLTSPATLEHLKFNISFRGNTNEFDNHTFYEHLGDDEIWGRLDSITTNPTGSRLQRVDIVIDYSFRYDDDGNEPDEDDVLEAVLDSLPLLRTKGILFVEAVLGR